MVWEQVEKPTFPGLFDGYKASLHDLHVQINLYKENFKIQNSHSCTSAWQMERFRVHVFRKTTDILKA